ncbi:MAG TPA: ROK family protein [Candidatus Sumerlaeota bacterium]|nr:ROK family protein [Candidatus Sumerlaeota bacterium]
MTDNKKYFVGIDLGTGSGAKVGLFKDHDTQIAETLLPRSRYGQTPESVTEALTQSVYHLLKKYNKTFTDLHAVGIATPGLLASDFSYVLASNLPFLNGFNLAEAIEASIGAPVSIENDANAGALAEWSVARTEILYWVFGGGWGGAWVSAEGEIRFPSVDWDGDDASLHYTSEPGYATPLSKEVTRSFLSDAGGDPDHFFNILRRDMAADGPLLGPSGSTENLRAEMALSGPGRHRMFRALTHNDHTYQMHLTPQERELIYDPEKAGPIIARLTAVRAHSALQVDRLFGRLLAEAAETVINKALEDGCRPGVPIFLGGKPSYALPHFGPTCQRIFGHKGIQSYLRPSIIDDRGLNANLVGAIVLAEKYVNHL